ncbi:MAG: AmmeMemoRadiSam system protein B [Candidatus Magasanikbacteria bacterium]|nr:AmmeMemoRadiSam system protein B [Candidatus Magasanikbacteria bacterium]
MLRKIFFIIGSAVIAIAGIIFVYLKISSSVAGSIVEKAPAKSESPYRRSTSLDHDWFEGFFKAAGKKAQISEPVVSAVVPHHLAAAVPLAGFFESIKGQKPPVVVLLGPNHLQVGHDRIVTSEYEWKTPYGTISPNRAVIQTLVDSGLAVVSEDVIAPEWSIGAVVPFIRRVWPKSEIVPLIVKDRTPTSTLANLASALVQILPPGSTVLVSVDFSHYLPYFVADFHDVLSENILATGDMSRLSKAEIDSVPSLYFLSAYNHLRGAETWHEVSHTNSATLAGHPEWGETTSHLIGYYTVGNSAPEKNITMQFFGDIMLDRNVAQAMGSSGLDYLLEKIRGQENRFFVGADLFMANLEGPFAPSRIQTSKTIAFRFDPKWAKQLKQYHFDAVTLANNHSLDMGRQNDAFTRITLEKNNIRYCGQEFSEGPELNMVLGEDVGLPEPVAFVCFETIDHEIDKEKVAAAILEGRQKARYVIVQVHGGTEYRRTSTEAQQELYHWLIDQGATAVIGHHPHVVEEIEIYKDKPIVYSLGNFIFDQYFSKETQEGLSVGVVLGEGKVKELRLFPMFGIKSQVELMTGERRADFMKWMSENSRLDGKVIIDGVVKF